MAIVQLRFIVLLLLLFPFAAPCQHAVKDVALLDSAIHKAHEFYSKQLGGGAHLYNGVAYRDYDLHNYDIGHPYFLSDDWLTGTVEYDGQFYSTVDLMYNIVRDKLVLDHPYSHFKLELISEKIKGFTLPEHTFVRLVQDSLNTIKTGFYELLYSGTVNVYARRKKEIQENLSAHVVITEFNQKDQYFIQKNGQYYAVKSKASVLKVFYDRKAMLRKYLTKNNIRFNKNRSFAMAESAKFYDQSAK